MGLCLRASESPGAEEKAAVELEEVEVVAPPIVEGNLVDPYGGEKTVVSSQQVEDLNAQDLSSTLRSTPGVTITRYNVIGAFGGGSGGAVFIRGMGSSRPGGEIKTLIDGVPVYNAIWNHPLLDLTPIDVAGSVEVYKGVQPSVFGNAFSVINLVPKRRGTEGFGGRLKAAYGRYDTVIQTAETGGKTGAFDYYAGQGFRRSHGHRKDSDGRLTDYYGRLGYRLNENWEAGVFFLHANNYARDPGPRGRPDLKDGKYETRQWLTTFTVAHRYDLAEGDIKAYWSTGEGDWRDQAGTARNTLNDWDLYGLRGKEKLHLWEGGEILVGTDLDYESGDAKFTYDDGTPQKKFHGPRFYTVSPYAALSQEFRISEELSLTPSAGVRFYEHSDFDHKWAPHAGVVLGYGDTELHAAYAYGVNYPGLDVVVFSEDVLPPLGGSWEDLDPETVDHYEVGVSHAFGKEVKAGLTLFYEDGRDRYVVVPPPPPPPVYENVEKFRTRGVDGTVTVIPLEDLSLFGGVTYLDPTPNDLPYSPKWTITTGAVWRFLEGFRLSLDAQYVDEMHVGPQLRRSGAENTTTVDSYFLLNAKVAYTVSLGDGGTSCEVFVAGENLTDTDYEYQAGYPMPGISVMGGVALNF